MTYHIIALYDCACSYLKNFQLNGFKFPKASLVSHLPPYSLIWYLCYRQGAGLKSSKIKGDLGFGWCCPIDGENRFNITSEVI